MIHSVLDPRVRKRHCQEFRWSRPSVAHSATSPPLRRILSWALSLFVLAGVSLVSLNNRNVQPKQESAAAWLLPGVVVTAVYQWQGYHRVAPPALPESDQSTEEPGVSQS